ncbi:S-methyl-5'-thioadenosine phosphorylase [Trichomonascus vanleenenianus]|uniref:S-methyl-5-thioadenosine phosphorylase n=1 Tax=Trichomonascus vanleenenianus TaxID=2268995 RepID=UPI003ECB9ADA
MSDLPTTFDEPVTLGVIGGTGLYHMSCLTPVARLHVETPWGKPSSPITISRTADGFPVAFLSRHGQHHQYTPTSVPARANIAALKKLGVKAIIAFSAVGSLQEHIKPRDFVVPNQVIDRTKGIRESTFFDTGFVCHAGFGDPFDNELGDLIGEFGHVLKGEHGEEIGLHSRKTEGQDVTLVCMEGPAFSTRAESRLYRSWGGSVINMSCIPESKLAREAEISYQMVCMSTDYDAWREGEEPVTVETVVGNLKANSANAEALIGAILKKVEEGLKAGKFDKLQGTMKFALSTSPHGINAELKEKLTYIFPNHW